MRISDWSSDVCSSDFQRVLCGLSGGVDSAVAAVLIHEAIGEQLTCVFVDHGLLRMNEREQVERLFRDHYNIPLVVVDAEARFMSGLAGVDRKSTRLNPSHSCASRIPPSACTKTHY